MTKTIVVTGHLIGPRSAELDEPVSGAAAEVEVLVRPVAADEPAPSETLSQFLSRLPPGTRTKEDIDQQIREERDSWGDR